MADLMPIIQTVELSQDDGRIQEFDVLVGYVFFNRTQMLNRIIQEGRTWEVKRRQGGRGHYFSCTEKYGPGDEIQASPTVPSNETE